MDFMDFLPTFLPGEEGHYRYYVQINGRPALQPDRLPPPSARVNFEEAAIQCIAAISDGATQITVFEFYREPPDHAVYSVVVKWRRGKHADSVCYSTEGFERAYIADAVMVMVGGNRLLSDDALYLDTPEAEDDDEWDISHLVA